MAPKKSIKKTIGQFTQLGITSLSSALLVVAAVGYLPYLNYWFDTISQLRLPDAYALTLLLPSAVLLRTKPAIVICAIALALDLYSLTPLFVARNVQTVPLCKIVTMNVWGPNNSHYAEAINYIRDRDPDIFCINEITADWKAALTEGLKEYPYYLDEGVGGGAAMFSKVAIDVPKPSANIRRYSVRCNVTLGCRHLLVIASHTRCPHGPNSWNERNAELERLAIETKTAKDDAILIGDLNSTPWSPFFRKLVNDGGLLDSELGFGLQPSFSTKMPLLLLPIDHCLTTRGLAVTVREVGPYIGSDHLPLCVEIGTQKPMVQ